VTVEDAGKNFDLIFFGAFGCADGTRSSFVYLLLDISVSQCQSGWTAVDDNANTPTMALTKAGYGKKLAQTIAHLSQPPAEAF
jgi:hypothetical protein